jgi:hypothetical protein
MGCKTGFAALVAAFLMFSPATVPTVYAAPPEDACSLLTQREVSDALGVSVGAGSHVTPEYLKTCTWATPDNPPARGKHEYVTLLIQGVDAFAGGKMMMGQKGVAVTSVIGLGDDAYYLGVGGNVGLIVKKGDVAFKVALYADIPVERKEAIEKTLALQVLPRL